MSDTMPTMRNQLSIREQQIESMEAAYKILHKLVTTHEDLTLEDRNTARVAMIKLYDSLNGVPAK